MAHLRPSLLLGGVSLLLLAAPTAFAATPDLRVFQTRQTGQLYSVRENLPGGGLAYTGDSLYFRRQLHLRGRVVYTEPGRGSVSSAVFGRPGVVWLISTPGHSQSVESYNIVKINLATGKVIARARTEDVGMVTSFPLIQEYDAARDWIRVRGARSFTVRGGLPSPNSEMYWLSLGTGGLKVEKAFPDGFR